MLRHAWAIRQSNADPLDRLRLHLGQRFDLAASNLRAFVSTVHRARDAHETFRYNQVGSVFIEIGKDDHLDYALEVFQREIGHPIALLGQHRFDRRDDAAELHLPTVRQFWQADGRGRGKRLDGRLVAGQRMGGNIEAGQLPFVFQSLALVPFRNAGQRRRSQMLLRVLSIQLVAKDTGLSEIAFALRGCSVLDGLIQDCGQLRTFRPG